MDPISGLSLVVNILQVVSFAVDLASKAHELSQSHDGASAENGAIEAVSGDLVNSINRLESSVITNDDSLKKLTDRCRNEAEQLLETLGTAKAAGESSKWRVLKVLKKTGRNFWVASDIKRRQDILDKLRLQIITHISTNLVRGQWEKMDGRLGLMAGQLQNIDGHLGMLISALASVESRQRTEPQELQELQPTQGETEQVHVDPGSINDNNRAIESSRRDVAGTPQTLLSDPSGLPPMRGPLAPGRPSRGAPALASNCTETHCACICHLGNYYKTPSILKRFFGALTFRGVCSKHPTKPSEFKYWFPAWISDYNIYFWLERNAHGTPSLGLRFRRKVSWGGVDTIIRFSFLGDTTGIKAVLEDGRGSLEDVDPNQGRTPLHYAVQRNHVQACELLLHVGRNMFIEDIEDESGITPKQKAWEQIFSNRGAPEVLNGFKTLFPNVDLDCWQFSPLHKAVLGVESVSITEQLKPDVGLDILNAIDAKRRTALHWASIRGDLKVFELLLDAGADANAVDELRCTPLFYAVSAAVPRMIELLILRKADVNFTNYRGDTPLHNAADDKDDVDSAKVLVRAGAQADRKNNLGNTPFSGAAIGDRVSSGRYLLDSGADMHSTNINGDTPLLETIYHNSHGFLEMLLQMGTKYDCVNKSGSTILHAAALEADTKTVGILKDFKMNDLDTQMKDNQGKTASDICQGRNSAPEGFKEAFLELLASLNPVSQSDASE